MTRWLSGERSLPFGLLVTHSYATDAKKKRREPQTKYRIGLVSNNLLGCVGLTGLTGTKLAVSSVVANYKLRNPRRFFCVATVFVVSMP